MVIYTDGGCKGNPGPGGWAFLLFYQGQRCEASGAFESTTNNQMELTAVIKALEQANRLDPSAVLPAVIHTDSQYVKNGITDWISKWKQNGWKTANRAPVKNRDLWMRLDELNGRRSVSWQWVRGHAGNPFNEACDSMVGDAISKL